MATINPLPSAGSDFLEVLNTFLSSEDAQRFQAMFGDFVAGGGTHSTQPSLTATPDSLVAFPGGVYITETGSITYADNSTTWVIVHTATIGNVGAYTRVLGTHYLTSVVSAALPADCVRLMKVTTVGGAITAVVDQRQLSPLVNKTSFPYLRLIGEEAVGEDHRIVEGAGVLRFQRNTNTEDEPGWLSMFEFVRSAFPLILQAGNTQQRTLTLPDKDDTLATLSDIGSSAFPAGTRLLFDNDTAPPGWVRDTTAATYNDRVVRIVTGARAAGGSWTITGITAAGHTHTLDHTHTIGTQLVVQGGAGLGLAAPITDGPNTTATSSATAAVSSDGLWRPLHRDVIVAEAS